MKVISNYGVRSDALPDTRYDSELFGPAVDGSATLNGSNGYPWADRVGNEYTLKRNAYLQNLTINSGVTLKTNGFFVFCTGTLTNGGTISNDGEPGNLSAAGSGIRGATMGGGSGGSGGVAGGGGSMASPLNYLIGPTSVTGGGGGAGGSGGGAGGTGASSSPRVVRGLQPGVISPVSATQALLGGGGLIPPAVPGLAMISGGIGGSGGGAGGGAGAGAGGGGGAGGGVMLIAAPTLANNGNIYARGGAGATGSPGSPGGGGGGGGGGAGGVIFLIYNTRSGNDITSTNVAGGSGGAGSGTGSNGSNGSAGSVIKFNAQTGTWE